MDVSLTLVTTHLSHLQRQEQALNRKIRGLKAEINNLQLELNEDLPVNIQALKEALQVRRHAVRQRDSY